MAKSASQLCCFQISPRVPSYSGSLQSFFVTVFIEGLGGDFDDKADVAELEKLEKLGLPKDNLEDAIKVALRHYRNDSFHY